MKKPLLFLTIGFLTQSLFVSSIFSNENSYLSSHPMNPGEGALFVIEKRTSLSAEVLYRTIQEGSLDYALQMDEPAWSKTVSSFAKGHFQKASFGWDPGFRVKIAYYNEPKYWDILGEYTWNSITGENQAAPLSSAGEFLTPTWQQISSSPITQAESSIQCNYNEANLLASRVFDTNPHLRLRVFGGFTGGWLSQVWKVGYRDTQNNTTSLNNKWRFRGGGLRIGLQTEWFWGGQKFYIIGKTSLATILGRYHNRAFQKTSYQPGLANPDVPVRDAFLQDTRFSFNYQIFLGPSWKYLAKTWDIEISAGYEFNLWLNLQEIYRSSQSLPQQAKETYLNTGVLALQGLSVRLTGGF